MTTYKQKIILVCIGLIMGVVLLEISLHIAALTYKYCVIYDKKVLNSKDENVVRVLCVGDSYTFGSGAERGFSYPEQLERLLNQNTGVKFRVYNLGIGSSNSSQTLKKLPAQLLKYSPDIVIIMTGCNDIWNFEDSNYYLFTADKRFRALRRLDGALMSFRSYKLLKIISFNMKAKLIEKKIEKIDVISPKKGYDYNVLLDSSQKEKLEYYIKLAQGYWNMQNRDHENAIKILNNALKLDPYNKKVLFLLGDIYNCSSKPLLSVDAYKKILEVEPNNIVAHKKLFSIYQKLDDLKMAYKEAIEVSSLDPKDVSFKMILITGVLPFRQESYEYKKLLYSNLEKMIEYVRMKKGEIILQTYPFHSVRSFDDVVKAIAKKYNAPIVDNAAIFDVLVSLEGYKREDYFVVDGHCTSKGYGVVAANVYNVLNAELGIKK